MKVIKIPEPENFIETVKTRNRLLFFSLLLISMMAFKLKISPNKPIFGIPIENLSTDTVFFALSIVILYYMFAYFFCAAKIIFNILLHKNEQSPHNLIAFISKTTIASNIILCFVLPILVSNYAVTWYSKNFFKTEHSLALVLTQLILESTLLSWLMLLILSMRKSDLSMIKVFNRPVLLILTFIIIHTFFTAKWNADTNTNSSILLQNKTIEKELPKINFSKKINLDILNYNSKLEFTFKSNALNDLSLNQRAMDGFNTLIKFIAFGLLTWIFSSFTPKHKETQIIKTSNKEKNEIIKKFMRAYIVISIITLILAVILFNGYAINNSYLKLSYEDTIASALYFFFTIILSFFISNIMKLKTNKNLS